MSKSRKIYFLPVVLIVLTIATAMAGLRSRGQTTPALSNQGQAKNNQIPIADYAASEPTDSEKRAQRRLRAKRYNKKSQGKVQEGASGRVYTRWFESLPALPVTQSDVVVISTVTGAQAYLSNDKTGVYSEFNINVEEALKNDVNSWLAPGVALIAERQGGRVRFPSGDIQLYTVAAQGMPQIGRQYILFLKRNAEEQDYSILTGYEIQAERIEPLDGYGPNGKLEFDIYRGWNKNAFLNTLRDLIARSSQPATTQWR